MTREEAKIHLKNLKSDAELYDGKIFKLHLADTEIEALEMAIKALEQENVIDKIRAEIEHDYEQDKIAREVFRDKKIAVRAEQCTGSISAYRNVLGIIDKALGRR